jgi:hypothetical protein
MMPLKVEGILADEKLLKPVEAQHFVAGGNPFDTGIGSHAGDEGGKFRARPRIPARAEGRIERNRMPGHLNVGDFHRNGASC